MLRFYREYLDAAKRVPTGNVIASDGYGAYMAVYRHPNSSVCYGPLPLTFLGEYCERITESEARMIHPRLFERIESDYRQDALAANGGQSCT